MHVGREGLASPTWEQGGSSEAERIDALNCLFKAAERRVYPAGTVVVAERQGRSEVGILARGTLPFYVCSPFGDELTLAYLSARGEVFRVGVVGGLAGDEFVAEVVRDDAEVYVWEWAWLEGSLSRHPAGIAVLLLRLHQCWDAEIALSDRALHPLPERVKRALQCCAVRDEGHMVHHTLDELARMVGATPEKVSREIAELDRQGLIRRVGRGRIEVPEPERLGE